jgi:cytochrome P450 family 6
MEMTYLEQILEESIRIFPPVATLHRITCKEYTLPNGQTIPEKTPILIPNLAIQRDPEYFDDPLKFDPDRFSDENKKSRHSFAFLGFGEGNENFLKLCRHVIFNAGMFFKLIVLNNLFDLGPRYCIGMRFGLLQTRLSLALLLNNFVFTPCEKTENPIAIDTIKLVHGPKGDVWLNIKSIQKEL